VPTISAAVSSHLGATVLGLLRMRMSLPFSLILAK